MKGKKYLQRQQSFYLFFMICAYVATLGFGTFYFIVGIKEIYITAYIGCGLFIIYGISAFVSSGLVTLFRISVVTTTVAFYIQVWYTGGVESPALFAFIIPPLLAFFYRPVIDRYIFMGISLVIIISFWPISFYGFTKDLLPEKYAITHSFLCGIFVFLIVAVFTVLFRNAIVVKNEKLGNSMKELQDTTQKLIQSEKMASLGVLSAGVAHEINNPLNFIKGGVEVLERELNNQQNADFKPDPYIVVIKEGLKRTSTIVNSLSHFSRETNAMDENCDIHAVLDNAIVMLQHRLKYKGVVEKEYDTNPAVVLGNEGKLHQAFLNIISNAEHAIDKDGTIRIKTSVSSGRIKVEVHDNGVGISKDHLHRISDPFFTTKPVGKGTGLGLAITYRIIEEHKGNIRVTSKVGKGTKFIVTFNRH